MLNFIDLKEGEKIITNDLKEIIIKSTYYIENGLINLEGNSYTKEELFYTMDEAIEYDYNLNKLPTCNLLDIRNYIDKIIQERENELLGNKIEFKNGSIIECLKNNGNNCCSIRGLRVKNKPIDDYCEMDKNS